MQLKLIKALWGMQGSYEEQFSRSAAEGYAGIEAPLPPPEQEQRFRELLIHYHFDYIAQVVSSDDHQASFAKQVMQAASFQPLLIVSHSARDCMSEAEQDDFFKGALTVESDVGIPIAHETHRYRAMFTPWTTSRLLRRFPELKITADFSHWCTVCESLLEDQAEHVALAVERAIHIHGRVGFAQGPQVPHPGAHEYCNELAAFDNWWKQIFAARFKEGKTSMTFTPEFGPPGYMHTLPFSNQAVVDLWKVNQWMAKHIEIKYKEWN
jgi:hypothetical protein